MSWFQNFSLIMRSSITSLTETIENPERLLHQLILDMEEELESVRVSVARAFADEIQMGKRLEEARADSQQWHERARAALRRKDETSARSALEQKARADERVAAAEQELARQKQHTGRLQRSVRDLESKVRQAAEKREQLVARLHHASAVRQINDSLESTTRGSALGQFRRLEKQVERAEALNQAHDRLLDHDPAEQELAEQFAEAERRERIERDYEELKRRVEG